MRITILGSGLVGGAIARDLSKESAWSVKAVDRSASALDKLPDRHQCRAGRNWL
jgi:saccharopine dehydrogenase-like NADP-dependent oxidoreductase